MNVRKLIEKMELFSLKTKSLFSERKSDGSYIVYSYGHHWPLFIRRNNGVWYENKTRSSRTTNKVREQNRPNWGSPPVYMDGLGMLSIALQCEVGGAGLFVEPAIQDKWKEIMKGWIR